MAKQVLVEWVEKALRILGGKGMPGDVARGIWQVRAHDLRQHGGLFYTNASSGQAWTQAPQGAESPSVNHQPIGPEDRAQGR